MPATLTSIAERYHAVLERITRAAQRAGRDPREVRLVVVTKAQPLERVQAVLEAGARDLGENYPEEAVPKIQALRPSFPDARWHMIGHLQRRKAPLVVEHFAMMHSVDRVRIAERLDRLCAARDRTLPVLLEFNVGGEASKSGWPAWDEAQWPTLLPEIERVLALPRLQVQGLMTVPPWRPDPEDVRPFFQRLRRLRDFLARAFPRSSWEHLSMGMSHDFEVAIEEGATFVRIGTAILGPRPTPAPGAR
ncbi:MAG: YggS family pyridoxal phosphate-dependent enzyme [Chloroflexi bacterium]|nr:YggS family pyridoxal phosphate-dependent enzyme [Chloroflexota bacterium]